jgi:hypothetical protein
MPFGYYVEEILDPSYFADIEPEPVDSAIHVDS